MGTKNDKPSNSGSGNTANKEEPKNNNNNNNNNNTKTPPPIPPKPSSAKPSQQEQPTSQREEETGGDEEVHNNASAGDFKDGGETNADGDESYSFWDRNKTFKPEKKVKGGKQEKLQKTIKATMKATLGGGDLRKTVQLPEGEDLNEWIAVNTVHFYNAANMIYGTCAEFCTDETCKTMSAGRNEYLWKDDQKYKKPTRVTAPVYIDLLLNWVNEQISNPDLFPVDENAKFPRNFMTRVKDIYKRLFRLYAHLYYSHFEKISSIGAKAHLNTCFKHFVFFILEFKLVDDKGLAPLKNFIDKFKDQKADE